MWMLVNLVRKRKLRLIFNVIQWTKWFLYELSKVTFVLLIIPLWFNINGIIVKLRYHFIRFYPKWHLDKRQTVGKGRNTHHEQLCKRREEISKRKCPKSKNKSRQSPNTEGLSKFSGEFLKASHWIKGFNKATKYKFFSDEIWNVEVYNSHSGKFFSGFCLLTRRK